MSTVNKSVVIVGGGGYIGFHIGLTLLRQLGHKVTLFDISAPDPEWYEEDGNGKCPLPLVKGSILSVNELTKAFQDTEANCVIHCASYGMSGKEQLTTCWDLTEAVNVDGTRNVINACCSSRIKCLVYTSTVNVVFGGQEIYNGDESLPYYPLHKHVDHYSRTKAIAEQLLLMADGKQHYDEPNTGDKGHLRTCALRLAGVMGVKEKRHLPRFVESLPLLKFVYGSAEAKVEFVSIQNVCQAHTKALEKLWEQPYLLGGEAYFISDGEPIGNFEFFRPLFTGLGYPFPKIRFPVWLFFLVVCGMQFIYNFLAYLSPSLTFQPFLTPCEVNKTGVTHYFKIDKAKKHFHYEPKNPNDVSEIVKYFQVKLNKCK